MKKYILLTAILVIFYGDGFSINKEEYKEYNLFFSVSKCLYSEKKRIDSVAYDVQKTLVEEINIKINSIDKKPYLKNYVTEDFVFNVILTFEDFLTIRVYEKGIEIFMFKQNKNSTVRYIFYDKNSKPYLIEAGLSISIGAIGAAMPRPPFGLCKKKK